jgi:hypothetical protein
LYLQDIALVGDDVISSGIAPHVTLHPNDTPLPSNGVIGVGISTDIPLYLQDVTSTGDGVSGVGPVPHIALNGYRRVVFGEEISPGIAEEVGKRQKNYVVIASITLIGTMRIDYGIAQNILLGFLLLGEARTPLQEGSDQQAESHQPL